MTDSGLEEIQNSGFGGVPNMLEGKRFTQNFRALRIVVEELLRDILSKVDTYESMMEVLETNRSQSKTTQLWVENLVEPIFIMMFFVRAEREADWPLHFLLRCRPL